MVDIEAAWSALRVLKRLGVKLALDDFGTGYSSLSYLRRFSLDTLKIDQSFVKGMTESTEDAAIVKHVVAMARALGMVTVAEGIETPEQLAALHRLGCEHGQGFLMSKPVPADEITRLLRQGRQVARPFGGVQEPRHRVPVNPFDRIDVTAPVSPEELLGPAQPSTVATGEPPLAAER